MTLYIYCMFNMKISVTGYVSPVIAKEFKLIAKENMMSISHMIERYIENVVEAHRSKQLKWHNEATNTITTIVPRNGKKLTNKIEQAIQEHNTGQLLSFSTPESAIDFLNNEH